MAHFVRRRTDVDWYTGYLFDPQDFKNSTSGIDVKITKGVNGDEGGVWAPSSAMQVAGAGMWMAGPCQLTAANTVELTDTFLLVFGDNDFAILMAGHARASRTIAQGSVRALAERPEMISTAQGTYAGTASKQPGARHRQWLRVHDGATCTQVVLHFGVGAAHANVPAVMPRVRVIRVDAAGVAVPLKALSATVDVDGWLYITRPASGAAWYAAAADQTVTYACDQNNVIDVSKYRYFLEVVDEQGANAFDPTAIAQGNIWKGGVPSYGSIADMRPQ